MSRCIPALILVAFALSVSRAAADHAVTQTERVPDSAVVSGVPQGMFTARSLLTGRAVCLLFLSAGRITRAIPQGGLDAFDWARHRADHSGDAGTWQMRGGQLVVTWGDGGVHQGPITERADGIEFYGKRYYKPSRVTIAAVVGKWEAARGTAIAGGPGINQLSELVITADGRYQWNSTTGGVVSGRAVANDRSMSGRVVINGLTLVLTSDAGRSTSHTFLPAPGNPVTAFSIDADMFTRSGPAPAAAPPPAPAAAQTPPPAASPGATTGNSYQGLAFTMPSGWTSSMQQGRFMLTTVEAPPAGVVIVLLSGSEQLNGRTFGAWLDTKMAADLAGGLKPLQSAPPTGGRSGAFETLSTGRTVQDQRAGVMLQIYQAISDGRQAGLAMVATATEAALKSNMPGVQTILQSLRLEGTPAAGAASVPPAPAIKSAVSAADLVGHWQHAGSNKVASSSVHGYRFNADGTYTYSFSGLIDPVNRTFLTESDSGTWGFEGGRLVIRSREKKTSKTFQIIQHQAAADGGASMTLLDVNYPPTDSNINVWGERFVRPRR